jgi:hypothetical protein
MYSQPPGAQKKNNTVLWVVLGALGVGGCGCLIAVGAAVLFPVFSQARLAALRTHALSNVKRSAVSVMIYAADNNDKYPLGDHWMDAVQTYSQDQTVFRSPLASKEAPDAYGFAFRKELSAKKTNQVIDPSQWIMIFDSTILTRNACSGIETLPVPGRYGSGSRRSNVASFADGHAKTIPDSMVDSIGKPGSIYK